MNSCDNMLTSSPKSFNAEDSLKVRSLGAATTAVANLDYDYYDSKVMTTNFTLNDNFYPDLIVTQQTTPAHVFKFRTELCKYWEFGGHCPFGDTVSFYWIYLPIVCICSW